MAENVRGNLCRIGIACANLANSSTVVPMQKRCLLLKRLARRLHQTMTELSISSVIYLGGVA